MKTYTKRFAHLKGPSILKVGEKVTRGDVIGVMGSSGASEAAHLHLDDVEGVKSTQWRLADVAAERVTPSPEQTARSVNKTLFGVYPVVTTAYGDYEYLIKYKKFHAALDLVPEDRHETQAHYEIHWPIPEAGTVTYSQFDNAYGNSVMVSYEA